MSNAEIETMLRRVMQETMGRSRPSEELVSITVAAATTGFSDKKIRGLIRGQKVTRYGKGRSTRVNLKEVLEALKREGQEPTYDAETLANETLGR